MNTYALAPRDWSKDAGTLDAVAEALQEKYGVQILGCGQFTMQFDATEEVYLAIRNDYREGYTITPNVWCTTADVPATGHRWRS